MKFEEKKSKFKNDYCKIHLQKLNIDYYIVSRRSRDGLKPVLRYISTFFFYDLKTVFRRSLNDFQMIQKP